MKKSYTDCTITATSTGMLKRKFIIQQLLLLIYLVLNLPATYAQSTVSRDGGILTVSKKIVFGTTSNPTSGIVAWSNGVTVLNAPVRQTEHTRKFKNIISFFVKEENTTDFLDDFTASVDLVIRYKASQTDPSYQTVNKTLTIDYKKRGRSVIRCASIFSF